jgi:hypothetical protein
MIGMRLALDLLLTLVAVLVYRAGMRMVRRRDQAMFEALRPFFGAPVTVRITDERANDPVVRGTLTVGDERRHRVEIRTDRKAFRIPAGRVVWAEAGGERVHRPDNRLLHSPVAGFLVLLIAAVAVPVASAIAGLPADTVGMIAGAAAVALGVLTWQLFVPSPQD